MRISRIFYIALMVSALVLSFVYPVMGDDIRSEEMDLGLGYSYVKDTIPDRLEPGRSYPVLITFRNAGLVSWERKNYRVGLVYGGNLTEVVCLPSFVEIPENSVVPPGQSVTFATSLLAVGLPGQYSLPFFVSYRNALGDQQVTEIWTKTVTIVPTDGVSSPVNGSILVESPLIGLAVFMGGANFGNVPCIIPDITPGSYELMIRGEAFERKIPVSVERGSLSRVFIPDRNSEPVIELKKINLVSDGTLTGYIEANILLVILVLVFVLGCIGVMIYGVRQRREDEPETSKAGRKKRLKEKLDDDADISQLEKDILEEYHGRTRLLEGTTPGFDPGSGSSAGQMKTDAPPHRMSNVRSYSRDMLGQSDDDHGGAGQGQGMDSSPGISTSSGAIGLSLKTLDIRKGSAMAGFQARNNSPDRYAVEGVSVGPGGTADISVEVPEPTTDEYEIILSLKVIPEKGSAFFQKIPVPYNRGVALLARGVIEKAYEFFHQIVRLNPANSDALLHQAEVLITWGLDEEAAGFISEYLSRNPTDSHAHDLINQIAVRKAERERRLKRGDQKRIVPGFPTTLDERYTAIRVLGKDAFASIILVLRKDTGDLRVLKIAHQDVSVSSSLYTEISMLYQLRHQNVLKMYRAEFNPSLFLELEYASGICCADSLCRTLADLPCPVDEEISLPLIEQIGAGLAYLHMKGVRHYNLNLKHILLDEPLTPKISGFIRESIPLGDSQKDLSFDNRAPEQIVPSKFGKRGKRTDIFQLGIVWYWLLTGKVPFAQGSVSPSGDGFVAGVYISPGRINPRYRRYDPLMKRLLALEKGDRYGSVDEFLAELRGLQMLADPTE